MTLESTSTCVINAAQIVQLLPHSGSMRLIECALHHDATTIICRGRSPADADHPLRVDDKLSALHAIEYAAQAMALHGRLMGKAGQTCAILAARGVEMHVDFLHDIFDPLHIQATITMEDSRAAAYRFSVAVGDRALAEGNLTVAFIGAELT